MQQDPGWKVPVEKQTGVAMEMPCTRVALLEVSNLFSGNWVKNTALSLQKNNLLFGQMSALRGIMEMKLKHQVWETRFGEGTTYLLEIL